MILEERTYLLDTRYSLADYVGPYVRDGLPVQISYLGEPVGAFTPDVGDLHALVSLWRYDNHEDRFDRRSRLAADPAWIDCLAVIRPMIRSMKNRILLPTSYSPLR